MPEFNDLMIDIETAGLPPNGALMAIGAVFFDLQNCSVGPTFSRTIHVGSSVQHGGVIDPGTFLFWLRQGDEARKSVAYNGQPVDQVLSEFSAWILSTCRHEDVRPWGNSNSFDLSILGGAYARLGLKAPWHFSKERDFRTVRNLHSHVEYDPSAKGEGAHNALTDAVFQVQHLFKIKQARTKAAHA
ncbi:3'-5' exonuclease [Comamonas sp.]|uniref:3'-5' exonuclease n=1 Tax=Comamonas sp. TaxID=34028 RepID=UPI0028B205D7|nr:3'-5' exonuclease [Comamonas sp.]